MDEIVYAPLAEIVKTQRTPAGTLLVYGRAAGETLDLDGQGLDGAWLAEQMPSWFKTAGNVREMHQLIAAGVAKELEFKDDKAWWVLSEAVDPGTISKLEAGVLTGYSVGIKAPRVVRDGRFPNGRIVGGKIIELSYGDRPADPLNKVEIMKTAGKNAVEDLEDQGVAKTVTAETLKALDEEPAEGTTAEAAADPAEPAPAEPAAAEPSAEASAEQAKTARAELVKDVWEALDFAAARGKFEALRGQLGEDPQGTEQIIAQILDTLIGIFWNEEIEAVLEDDELGLVAKPDKTKTTNAPKAAGEPAPDLTKLAAPDAMKTMMADVMKATLEDGLAPVKEELAKVVGLTDRVDKLEGQPAAAKVVLSAAERGSTIDQFTDVDPKSALGALRRRHQEMADGAVDSNLKQAHISKIAELDKAIAALP